MSVSSHHHAFDVAEPHDLVWRWTVDQFHQMIQAGILGDDDRVELLDGCLVAKMINNPRHATATDVASRVLQANVPAGWFVRTQLPMTLAQSEPEPDAMVIRGDSADYVRRHPGPQDVAVVVEVADATLVRDRGLKQRLYAEAEVAIYWIVNLPEKCVEVYTHPSGSAEQPEYRQRRTYDLAEEVPLVLEGRQIASIPVRLLLPS